MPLVVVVCAWNQNLKAFTNKCFSEQKRWEQSWRVLLFFVNVSKRWLSSSLTKASKHTWNYNENDHHNSSCWQWQFLINKSSLRYFFRCCNSEEAKNGIQGGIITSHNGFCKRRVEVLLPFCCHLVCTLRKKTWQRDYYALFIAEAGDMLLLPSCLLLAASPKKMMFPFYNLSRLCLCSLVC